MTTTPAPVTQQTALYRVYDAVKNLTLSSDTIYNSLIYTYDVSGTTYYGSNMLKEIYNQLLNYEHVYEDPESGTDVTEYINRFEQVYSDVNDILSKLGTDDSNDVFSLLSTISANVGSATGGVENTSSGLYAKIDSATSEILGAIGSSAITNNVTDYTISTVYVDPTGSTISNDTGIRYMVRAKIDDFEFVGELSNSSGVIISDAIANHMIIDGKLYNTNYSIIGVSYNSENNKLIFGSSEIYALMKTGTVASGSQVFTYTPATNTLAESSPLNSSSNGYLSVTLSYNNNIYYLMSASGSTYTITNAIPTISS